MKLKNNLVKKIWKESISTLIIVTAIIVTIGHTKSLTPTAVSAIPEIVMADADELPSTDSLIETPPVEIKEVSIDQLVADVESGKAGNGKDRIKYLGEYYEEVQAIINRKYQTTHVLTSRGGTISRATSGNKYEYQSYAHTLVIEKGWSENDYQSLIYLWEKESGWNPNSHNKSSGAHGIPQSLPASKMSSHGDDYYTNGCTQIRWGLEYILNRYGSPTAAWNHFLANNWY